MAVLWTARRCAVWRSESEGRGAESVRERALVVVLKMMARWVVGRVGGVVVVVGAILDLLLLKVDLYWVGCVEYVDLYVRVWNVDV
jgi:hypothetical protein